MSRSTIRSLQNPLRRALAIHTSPNPSHQAHPSRAFSSTPSPSTNASSTDTATQTDKKQKHEWLVIFPDQQGALDRRLSVRSKHLEKLTPAIDSGFWLSGGALLEEHPREGETPRMCGSVMLALAESREDVIAQLRRDPYSEGKVWDWDRVQIHAFRSAFRKGT